MIISLDWAEFKVLISDKSRIRFFDRDTHYYIIYIDDVGEFETSILKDSGSNQTDFEANYKNYANKRSDVTTTTMPFTSKTLANGKKLYKRVHGIQQALTVGNNTVLYTIPYAWIKMTGLQLINCEALDTVSLYILDSSTGTYSTVPNYVLNQFGFTVNCPKDYYQNYSEFDADLYIGMQIKAVYTSVSAKTVGVNFILNEVK